MRELYEGIEYVLRSDDGDVRRFLVRLGVRQGSNEGHILYILLYAGVMCRVQASREAFDGRVTVQVERVEPEQMCSRTIPTCNPRRLVNISDLAFADDVATFALFTPFSQISRALYLWSFFLTAVHLEVNWEKTQIMILWIGRTMQKRWKGLRAIKIMDTDTLQDCTEEDVVVMNRKPHLKVRKKEKESDDGGKTGANNTPQVEVVREFKYLGSWFTQNWGAHKEVRSRIALATAVLARLALRVWRSKILPAAMKIRLHICLVLSVLLHALPASVLSEGLERELEVFHVRAVRRVLGCPVYMDRRTHSEVLRDNKVHTIRSQLRKRQLQTLKPLTYKNDNTIALRSGIWSPYPWESGRGGEKTQRLAIMLEDLKILLTSNGRNIPDDESEDDTFRRGLCFLNGATKKQLDAVLSFCCEHLNKSSRKSDRAEHGADTAADHAQCPICDKMCKNSTGVRIHGIQVHKLLDSRRESITSETCPACLTSYEHLGRYGL